MFFSPKGKAGWGGGEERERLTDQVKEQGRVTQLEGAPISEKSHALKLERKFALQESCVPGLAECNAEESFTMRNRQVMYVGCVPNLVRLYIVL